MAPTKTDNKYLIDKIVLRLDHLPAGKRVRVFNAFGGKQIIWQAIKRIRKDVEIEVLSADKIGDLDLVYLRGDNLKYMARMDLSKFDVIDLDAYGCPVKQIDLLFRKQYRGMVFVTFIQSMNGVLPHDMLFDLGFTKAQVEKCPSLFNLRGLEKMMGYLYTRGVRKIWTRSKNRHNYLCFEM